MALKVLCTRNAIDDQTEKHTKCMGDWILMLLWSNHMKCIHFSVCLSLSLTFPLHSGKKLIPHARSRQWIKSMCVCPWSMHRNYVIFVRFLYISLITIYNGAIDATSSLGNQKFGKWNAISCWIAKLLLPNVHPWQAFVAAVAAAVVGCYCWFCGFFFVCVNVYFRSLIVSHNLMFCDFHLGSLVNRQTVRDFHYIVCPSNGRNWNSQLLASYDAYASYLFLPFRSLRFSNPVL